MTSLRDVAAALAIVAALLSPARALAYCRTITQPVPADFDQGTGCFDPSGAIPLWWSNACVGFSVQENASRQISLADAESHTLTAFQRWMNAGCAGGGNPSIAVSDEGPVACDSVGYSEAGPNQHVIIFRDTSWPYSNAYNTLALTTVTFDTDTGEIYDADVEVNTNQTMITVNTTPGPNQYDFDSIITHEAGHFLGLAHSPDDSAVMFWHYKPESTTLTDDDVAGICAVYAPSGVRATEFDAGTSIEPVSVQEAACDPTPRHGFGSACGVFGETETTTTSGCAVSAGSARAKGGGRSPTLALFGALVALGIARRRRTARIVRMRRLRAVALCSVLAAGAAAVGQLAAEREARASISIAVLFDELVRDSTAVAITTPYEQRAVWEDGRIITYTHVHADRPVAGTLENDPWVRTMGGTVGRVGQIVDGEPVLTVGHTGLLFLQPSTTSGVYSVTARAQGQFPVVLGPHNVPIFRASSGVGGLVPASDARVSQASQLRARAGLPAEAPRATDVLHTRPVEDGVRDVIAAWGRLHGTK